ncbi:type VI secretion protein [Streptomyces sp. NBC_01210]|uniref:type VI secretion protein n=1 Tax=Streptomyces sp. NBC_01210 TaxID=2903774 RepID=UPI002E15AE02|nr:type VI secretion protein [Streptomyces sp. NBC_01210]
MRDRRHYQHAHERDERGIPDGLLVGLLGFLLGLSLLVWTATGLAGVITHGSWPTGVTYAGTPLAIRALASKPHDLQAAWPDTPPAELSGYGLFWGLAIGELMVLVVVTVFVLGTVARWHVGRAGRVSDTPSPRTAPAAKTEDRDPAGSSTAGSSTASSPTAGAHTGSPDPTKPADGRLGQPRDVGQGASGRDPRAASGPGTPSPGAPTGPYAGATSPDPAREQGAGGGADAQGSGIPTGSYAAAASQDAHAYPGTGYQPGESRHPSAAAPGDGAAASPHPAHPPASRGAATSPHTRPAGANPLMGQGTGGWDPHAALPAPRTPRILYGDPATRRPVTVQAVLDAEGPALVVTSDPTVWAETKGARAKLGPVLVYDPGHLCDTPARLHWSPTAHCEDAATAAARAVALLAPIRPRALLDAAMADTAETLLRCWLHAAAVDGRPFKQLHRWAQGGGAHDAVRILRTHPKATAGLAGLLESTLTGHPERREIAQQLVVRALSVLSSIHIREACTPNRTDSLTLESFINEGGTLYVVGEPIEDPRTHPGAMPLLTALASDVVEHGRRMAARSSDGRLDPPMTLVLDDVAAVAPLPSLPELLATGQDQGLPTLVLLRSAEQARARWPEPLTQ